MNRKEAAELLPIIKAFSEGKEIQYKSNGSWYSDEDIVFIGETQRFRIKPETKYRPFKDTEECWAEMLKHQPFGWVKNKESQALFVCKAIGKFIAIGIEDTHYTYKYSFDTYTFADGLPFGVKIEKK